MHRNTEHRLTKNITNNNWDQYPLHRGPSISKTQWLMHWSEILLGGLSDSTFSFLFLSWGQLPCVQCEKPIYLTRIPLCAVTSGNCCLLRCRDQSVSWWKTMRIKGYPELDWNVENTQRWCLNERYTSFRQSWRRRLYVIGSFLGFCLCYPTDTLKYWTSLATGTGVKNIV